MLENINNLIEKLKKERDCLLAEKEKNEKKIAAYNEFIDTLTAEKNSYGCEILILRAQIRSHETILSRNKKHKLFKLIHEVIPSSSERSIAYLTNKLSRYQTAYINISHAIDQESKNASALIARNENIDTQIEQLNEQIHSKTPQKRIKRRDKNDRHKIN